MNAGIYCIENTRNGKIYVGQAKELNKRIGQHRRLLRINKHYNAHLQNSYNKFGKDSFSFRILEKTDDLNLLNALENKWIAFHKSFAGKSGYNIQYPSKVFRIAFARPLVKKIISPKVRKENRPKIKTNCPVCDKEFIKNRYWQKYCSKECRKKMFDKRHNLGLKEQIHRQGIEIEKLKEKIESLNNEGGIR